MPRPEHVCRDVCQCMHGSVCMDMRMDMCLHMSMDMCMDIWRESGVGTRTVMRTGLRICISHVYRAWTLDRLSSLDHIYIIITYH